MPVPVLNVRRETRRDVFCFILVVSVVYIWEVGRLTRRLRASLSAGLAFIAVAGGGVVWRLQGSRASARRVSASIQRVLEAAVKQSVQIVPVKSVPLATSTPLSSVTVRRLEALHQTELDRIFAGHDYIRQQMLYYTHALRGVIWERNSAMTISDFTFTSLEVTNFNETATAAFSALSSTTSDFRPSPSDPWHASHIPGNWVGTATLQHTTGGWLVRSLRLTDKDAG